ncbi:hypothetical protein EDB80DRAFT_811060, partial [Ilyonectria destructans]
EDGDDILNLSTLEAEKRKRLLRDTTPLQRDIIRHLVLDISFLECLLAEDSKAGRLILNYAAAFARKFFKQNLISQVGIIGMYNGVAVRISDVGGNPSEYLGRLKGLENQDPQGNPSL